MPYLISDPNPYKLGNRYLRRDGEWGSYSEKSSFPTIDSALQTIKDVPHCVEVRMELPNGLLGVSRIFERRNGRWRFFDSNTREWTNYDIVDIALNLGQETTDD